jgi:hypothetical protein
VGFSCLRTAPPKTQAFPTIRAMLHSGNKIKRLNKNDFAGKVTQFCGFFRVNIV